MNRHWLTIAAIFLGLAGRTLYAQEQATSAERTYRELRKSHDTKTQLMAERWYGLIKLQDWADASGKFKTTAKYVEHDPNLAWVKLREIQGSGNQRIVKDVTIPLSKLNKEGQSRVRQISVLAEKVAAAEVAEKEADKKKADGSAGEMAEGPMKTEQRMMSEEPRGRRGRHDAGLAGMDATQVLSEGERPRRPRRAESARSGPARPVTNNSPLPALLPPLPSDRAQLGKSPTASDEQQAPPEERHGH